MYGRCTEKGIGQRDRIYFCHRRVVNKVGIDEEEDGHIDGLSSIEPLLFETEALDFAKIWGHLSWSNTIGSDPNDILSTLVRSRIERERCLPWQDADLSLLWSKFPRQNVRH